MLQKLSSGSPSLRAPCMFDWQGTQTQPRLFSPLSNAKPQIRSLVCTLRTSKWIIQITHFALVWKQSVLTLTIFSQVQNETLGFEEACWLPLSQSHYNKCMIDRSANPINPTQLGGYTLANGIICWELFITFTQHFLKSPRRRLTLK